MSLIGLAHIEEFIGDSTDNDKNPRFVTGKACEKRNDIRKNIVVQNPKQATEHIRKSGKPQQYTLDLSYRTNLSQDLRRGRWRDLGSRWRART